MTTRPVILISNLLPITLVTILLSSPSLFGWQQPETKTTRHENPVKYDSLRLDQLCLDQSPDGLAVVVDSSNREYVILFKDDHFFIAAVEDLRVSKPLLLTNEQQFSTQRFLAKFQNSENYIISMPGSNKNYQFFNNILVFHKDKLFRYKVTSIQINSTTPITVELLGEHSISNWIYLPSIHDIKLISAPRDMPIVLINMRNIRLYAGYNIKSGDLDSPLYTEVKDFKLPMTDKLNFHKIRHAHQLASQEMLVVMENGDICIDAQCKQIKDLSDCDPQVSALTNTLVFWLWKRTGLTLRLIMISLSSFMMVNYVLAMSFIYNQIMNIYDLT